MALMAKVLSLKNSPTPEGRAEVIQKYSFDKRFWSDFPDNKPHDSEDILMFLLAPFEKIKSLPPNYDKEKKILIRISRNCNGDNEFFYASNLPTKRI